MSGGILTEAVLQQLAALCRAGRSDLLVARALGIATTTARGYSRLAGHETIEVEHRPTWCGSGWCSTAVVRRCPPGALLPAGSAAAGEVSRVDLSGRS